MPVPVVTEPISRIPTRETVAETLRSWIIDGTLAPMEVLRDTDLANAFGISRTPVREALLRLEHEGLVESQPGRWTRVAPLDPATLPSLHTVWAELETLAARLAATAPPGEHAAIEAAARTYMCAVAVAPATPTDDQIRTIRDAAAGFFDAILVASGNPHLSSTLTQLRQSIRRYECTCPHPAAPDASSASQINAILAAIVATDSEAAELTTCTYLQHTYRRLHACWNPHTSD